MFHNVTHREEDKIIFKKILDDKGWSIEEHRGGECACSISFECSKSIDHSFIHFLTSLLRFTNPISHSSSFKENVLTFNMKYDSKEFFFQSMERLRSNIKFISSIHLDEAPLSAPSRGESIQSMRVSGHDYF